MRSLKLESFSHDVEIRRGISKFESFEALRDSAYSEGVKAGAEATTRAFEEEKIRTLAPILEALNDMAFTQVEACRAMVNSMQPMLEQMVKTLLPESARLGFGAEVSALICKALEKAPAAKLVISVSPDSVPAMQSMLAPAKAEYTIEPDPNMGGLEARISWKGGYDQIDLDATLTEIRDAITAFFTPPESTGTNDA